ncbi:succinylglutamate desuccinylase [Chitinibacter bivalviorum]|uniref:Succinylglutamate desuccinylase n=1 Tax=Chitinibacter bivalviorum TaxID=2739434 RepID=A0A7H9BGM8_9NEIS|nr:succinylglutamate desuccinylase [Chitinibacter bivalviorum]QLG87416.1 succinylglutamate desuccinylase [Chitinibacter bivalviorum]
MSDTTFLQKTLAGETAMGLPYCLSHGTAVQVLDEGVIRFEPSDATQSVLDLVISCGIHGNETAPVELVEQLIERIFAHQLRVKSRVLFIFGNVAALRMGQRFVEEDMNRLFNRSPEVDDGMEKRRAMMLEMHVGRFFSSSDAQCKPRFHYDLHTAIHGSLIEKFAIYPLPKPGCSFSATEIARLSLAGVDTVLLQSTQSSTFSFSSNHRYDAQAFTIELGSARPFGQNQSIDLSKMDAYLSALIQGELPVPELVPPQVQIFRVSREIPKTSHDFKFAIDGKTDNFTPLAKGLTLAVDAGVPFVITEDDARIIFPNPEVPPGQRAGLVIVPARDFLAQV